MGRLPGNLSRILPLFVLIVCYFFVEKSHASSEEADDPEPTRDRVDLNEYLSNLPGTPEYVRDMLEEYRVGPFKYWTERKGEIDEDTAYVIFTNQRDTIRSKQCTACIDACRVYSLPEARVNMLENALEGVTPTEFRSMQAMKQVAEIILSRYDYLEGAEMPIHHAARECTVVYRSYLDTFLQEQINNIEPGSPSDAFYGFETRLSPELRLNVLQEQADWFKTSDSIEWTKCELEDTSFGEDELKELLD